MTLVLFLLAVAFFSAGYLTRAAAERWAQPSTRFERRSTPEPVRLRIIAGTALFDQDRPR